MRAVLKAQINKTDRNDARGMAQMMRVGLYRPVHVKTLSPEPLDPSIREGGRLVLVKNLFGVLCDLCTKIEFVDWRSRHLP
jgi:transposase